jgi:hypothetical protein
MRLDELLAGLELMMHLIYRQLAVPGQAYGSKISKQRDIYTGEEPRSHSPCLCMETNCLSAEWYRNLIEQNHNVDQVKLHEVMCSRAFPSNLAIT